MSKSKRMMLSIHSIEAFLIACLLTGRREKMEDKVQAERLDNNIVRLLKVMDWHDRYQYYKVLLEMDWSKVEKMKPKFEAIAKAVKRKDTNSLTTAFAALLSSV